MRIDEKFFFFFDEGLEQGRRLGYRIPSDGGFYRPVSSNSLRNPSRRYARALVRGCC